MIQSNLGQLVGIALVTIGSAQAQSVQRSELASPQRIRGAELESLVKGAAVYSTTDTGIERDWVDAPNGTLAGHARRPAGGLVGTGQGSGVWRIDNDRYCVDIRWRAGPEAWCAQVLRAGDRYYLARGNSPESKARLVRFEK